MNASTAARNGQRVPNPPPQQGTKPSNNGHQPPAKPTATITTMIVCLPDGLSREPLTAHQLDRHFGVSGTLQPRFWSKSDLYLWQWRRLIGRSKAAKNQPVWCAGGPARLLDLTGMRQGAGMGAGIRHQLWQQAVQGTKPAQPWVHFHTRHVTEPDKYSYEQAAADFWQQPRVTAMRVHNAANIGTPLAVDELEMLQAGPLAYQHHSAMTAICGDALLTAEGRQLAPASDAFNDRVTYLEQAIRCLDTIADTDQRLIAVSL
ncbi:hypothetical protein [Paractinoplanes durhamensis]|uniref:Uncharacterized protein n=2 Tax=Paractinoplanes durhamensis TaxID=113563 RepID=A0ABQ3Z0S2_9ACTN|nr:hypothetical protein [Actinoplanes durhamensis]GIE03413.1 hypothetical protein Adu01nite_47630 [Actinoplanes durhamensis]